MDNFPLATLTVLIALIAAYAVNDISERVAVCRGTQRRAWLMAGAVAMGFGVWTMHLIGMRACQVPMSASYDFWLLGLSMLVSVLSSYLVLVKVKRRRGLTKSRILLGALLMGAGIVAVYVLNLRGVQVGFTIEYDLPAAALSLLFAWPVLYLVLSFTFLYPERKRLGRRPHKVISAVLMGLSFASIHYVTMQSTAVRPVAEPVTEAIHTADATLLSFSLGIAALLIQVLVLLGALFDRRLALRSASLSEQRLRSLFAHNPFAVFMIDIDGNVTDVNGAAELMLGYGRAELLGKSFKTIIEPETVQLMIDRFRKSLAGETPNYDVNVQHKSGVRLDLRVTNVPLIIDARILGAYVIAEDITEQKRAQELLHRSDKLTAVGQLAAGIAHEIRNPLTAIKGFTQLLKEKAEHSSEYYDVILSELDRANLIVSEFLLLAKPQSSKFRPASLDHLLLLIVTLLEPQAILNDVRIVTRFQSVPEVHIEENQIKQVLLNLLKNAIEAMPDGGELLIELGPCGAEQVCIRLTDQGIGIPEEQLQKLGDPFFSTKEEGTGLGLMVSFKIIEDHGGRLEIQSEVGVGTTIDVLLPVTPLSDIEIEMQPLVF
ncbi:ATP-binding protein [Tumebacillus sp. BK434]|uniref:ATP-binding protein n=1 Tax=Tumebacillus sp. BK434 TaxID=2512169 RepID=UPI001405290A|nr:ATP-binding protein [Tumebacillus sp. BK434]